MNDVPDFGVSLPAFRAGKKPHYVQVATPKAKQNLLRRRRSSQSFGSSYGSFGEKKYQLQEEQNEQKTEENNFNNSETYNDSSTDRMNSTHTQHQQQYQQHQPHRSNPTTPSGRSNISSQPVSREGGLMLARAPSRDVGWPNRRDGNRLMMSSGNTPPTSMQTSQRQRQQQPSMRGTTPSHLFSLEKNALSRHTKRLSMKTYNDTATSSTAAPDGGTKKSRRSSTIGLKSTEMTNKATSKSKSDGSTGKNNNHSKRRPNRSKSSADLTSTTVTGLLDEMKTFYNQGSLHHEHAEENKNEEGKNEITSTTTTTTTTTTTSRTAMADMLQRESVRFHPAIVANVRLLYNTFTRQYGNGFGFGQYIILCRKILMAVLGGDAYSNLSKKEIYNIFQDDWKEDSQDAGPQAKLNFEQFWKAMYHLIDAWSPGKGAPERIEWFDRLVQKVIYQDAAGNSFMAPDDAVNDIGKRQRLETTLHKSLMIHPTDKNGKGGIGRGGVGNGSRRNGAGSESNQPKMYRPRRMSLHRGMVGVDVSMFASATPASPPSSSSSSILHLDGGISDILVSPSIKATVIQRGSGSPPPPQPVIIDPPLSSSSSRRTPLATPPIPTGSVIDGLQPSYDITR